MLEKIIKIVEINNDLKLSDKIEFQNGSINIDKLINKLQTLKEDGADNVYIDNYIEKNKTIITGIDRKSNIFLN